MEIISEPPQHQKSSGITKWFASRIKDLRGSLGITQEQLALLSGLPRTHIAHIERGAREINLTAMEKIADALNLSVHDLLADYTPHHQKTSLPPRAMNKPIIVPPGDFSFQQLCDLNPGVYPLAVLRFLTERVNEGKLFKYKPDRSNHRNATYTNSPKQVPPVADLMLV
jgi:transcriptional regulator with XRE-family HTH domain